MLPRLWLLIGSDRPTDRQCQLLSCPGQLISEDLVGCYHSGTDRWRKGKIGLLSQMDHWRLSWAIAMVDSYSEDDLRRLRWQQWWWPIYPMGWRLKCATTQMFRFLSLPNLARPIWCWLTRPTARLRLSFAILWCQEVNNCRPIDDMSP